MGFFDPLTREIDYIRTMRRSLKRVAHISPDMTQTAADIVEHWAQATPEAVAIRFEDRHYTYKDYDEAGNRYARWALSQGVGRGDCVALLMENRPEFLFAWLGMAKVGAITALINTNLQGTALAHSLNISGAKHLILGAELADHHAAAEQEISPPMTVWSTGAHLSGAADLDAALAAQSPESPGLQAREGLKGRDTCFYIYTSGTTGLPKAAHFPHMRVHSAMHGFSSVVNSTSADTVYCPLPLYHSAGGVAAVGVALSVGGTLVIRRKFSATAFWNDCVNYDVTIFQYIGELCRYLLNTEEHPLERSHRLRAIVGNGLRPDIWRAFQERFQIPKIIEFYASTEGNVTLVNYDGKEGAIGRIPPYAARKYPVRLVKFDVDEEKPARGPDGFCIECKAGEVGEAIGRISEEPRERFDGYRDKAATEKKILHDVFEKGDRWFRTGDLLQRDGQGYYFFIDRIGDTFRWKGENVSTSEVALALSSVAGVQEVNVYGVKVPGADGRAGMASLVLDGELDLKALKDHAAKELPSYAQPLFIRIQPEIEITGTFKHRKVDLVKEGFNPHTVRDPLYFLDPESDAYVPLDAALYERICDGVFRF